MSATTLVSVAEYRSTVYEPEMDYVDGVLEDRNVGERDHASVQGQLLFLLKQAGFRFTYPELRLQVNPTRYRVPDVCVFLDEPKEQVPTVAPVLAIEVLSPEDRMSRMQVRLDDYIAMGCPCVWVIDPALKKGYVYDGKASTGSVELTHPTNPALRLRLSEVF